MVILIADGKRCDYSSLVLLQAYEIALKDFLQEMLGETNYNDSNFELSL